MKQILIYPIGSTDACRFAYTFLVQKGIAITDHPMPEITHLLLDVPSFGTDGMLRSGGDIRNVLAMLPRDVIIIGGNLNHPGLEGYRKIDLLQDEEYLALNAAITADCALQVAAPFLHTTFADTPTLIIGWGRIGKCLGQMLRSIGCSVTIAARKATDRALIRALGHSAVDITAISGILPECRLILNTAPEMILDKEDLQDCRNCVKIDLASKPGLGGADVVWARGLPGVHAPESSGKLIAECFLRINREEL